jgi:hypothetical protein
MAERTMAWAIYRASGNQSEYAIRIYSKRGETPTETQLRQRDCALELAWLEAGHPAEWLDAPLKTFREEAARRGVSPIEKDTICDGFTENRKRGTIASGTGQRLVLVPSPKVGDSTNDQKTKGEETPHQQFQIWAKVPCSAKLAEKEVARATIKSVDRFLLSLYKKWRKLPASERNVRLRQGKRSGAKRRLAAGSRARGAGKGTAVPFPAQYWSGLAGVSPLTMLHVFSSSRRHAFRCGAHGEPGDQGCHQPPSAPPKLETVRP